jgi:hypothetical protein
MFTIFCVINTLNQVIILNALRNIHTAWIWNKNFFAIYINHLLLWQVRISIWWKVLFLCINLRFLYLISHRIPMISDVIWLGKSHRILFYIMIKLYNVFFVALNCLVICLSDLNKWRMISLYNFLCIRWYFIFIRR